jgi:tRNA G18 (ribose-2'-O)-methylase SpoU
MVESEMVVRRLLDSKWNIHSLFLSPQKYERLRFHIKDPTIQVYIADVSLMSSITGFHIHRGTLALVHRPNTETLSISNLIHSLQSQKRISLLLAEGITNVDNIGALFRNAAAFGVDAMVLDHTCCDPLYRKAIRVSMGHALTVPWAVSSNWIEDMQLLKSQLGLQIIGCETGQNAIPMWKVNPTEKVGLVMGEEKSGLSASTIMACDIIAEIPMANHVPSVNVAVASAIGLYELLCRNRFNDR